MAAQTFQELINRIQASGLNFKIELSPFSAKVTLKKTFTKDLNGNALKTQFSDEVSFDKIKAENSFLQKKVLQLEQTSCDLLALHQNTLLDYQQVYQTNQNLLVKVEDLHSKLLVAEEENLGLKSESIPKQNTYGNEDILDLEHTIFQQTEEVFELTSFNESLQEQIQKLSLKLSESEDRFDEEMLKVKQTSKKEIKSWKKELGEERRIRINLENKLKHASSVENQTLAKKFLVF